MDADIIVGDSLLLLLSFFLICLDHDEDATNQHQHILCEWRNSAQQFKHNQILVSSTMSAAVAPGAGSVATGAPPPPPPPSGGGGQKRGPSGDGTPTHKRAAAEAAPCCRCLRRLTTNGGAAGTMVACIKRTPTGRVAVNCQYCQRGKRGGATGCVPVHPTLVTAATRLMVWNRMLVAGEEGAPTKAQVEAAADDLDGRMYVAPTTVGRKVAGGTPRGGRLRSASGSAAGAGVVGGEWVSLLRSLVGVLRTGVEAYIAAHNLPAPVWSDEESSLEESSGEDEDE
ncbi:hypothetical protein Z517_09346 [Fonsecaea pedrosoi CBS 271.37]|uniref:Uncharacterized protein n=1 Tax=Fonsecaea pedrosoi CBS 271.37 TaxID=1442368 RepID=A0A0D2ERM0_9EURO|nr:uncharacterized protein Z517_09346 [Fonsecaea pedrosoi CBS 271.37]KIW76902.1 hypothetical protein Z517_09346 [Fonsecaea pedrosoi CBS 271.37]